MYQWIRKHAAVLGVILAAIGAAIPFLIQPTPGPTNQFEKIESGRDTTINIDQSQNQYIQQIDVEKLAEKLLREKDAAYFPLEQKNGELKALEQALEDLKLRAIATPVSEQNAFDDAFKGLEKGKVDEAESLFEVIALAVEKSATKSPQETAKAYRNLGAVAFLTDTKKAIQAYLEATALAPNNSEGWNQLAHSYLRAGEINKAIDAYNHLLALGKASDNQRLIALVSNLDLLTPSPQKYNDLNFPNAERVPSPLNNIVQPIVATDRTEIESQIIEVIFWSTRAICHNPKDAGKYLDIEVDGSGFVKISIRKLLRDFGVRWEFELNQEEWEGVISSISDYRACVHELLSYMAPDIGSIRYEIDSVWKEAVDVNMTLRKCSRVNDSIACDLTLLSEKNNVEFYLEGRSYFYDQSGRRYRISHAKTGNLEKNLSQEYMSFLKVDLIPGVLTALRIEFEGVSTNVEYIMRLHCNVRISKFNFNYNFRNIPIQIND